MKISEIKSDQEKLLLTNINQQIDYKTERKC